MARVASFDAVSRPDARVLVLGSMPGRESLRQQRYYAHPRNSFWPLMGEIFGAGAELDYDERIERLLGTRVALWDVLRSCARRGSLDARIEAASEAPNDFERFFAAHPQVRAVFFNGRKAAEIFRKRVLDDLPRPLASGIDYRQLPSTSPANAAMSFADKLARWTAVRDALR